MRDKNSVLREHNELLLMAAETRSAYYDFFKANDENVMSKSADYEDKLNSLKEAVWTLIENSPSKG